MEKITISPLLIEDYAALMELWGQCEGVGLSDADSMENIRRFLTRNPGLCFVASRGNRIIGTILAGHDGRRGYIYHLAVHPDQRRQDIGGNLVDRSLKALGEAGIQKCHLFVFKENDSGIAFWNSVGWEERSDLKVMSKHPGETDGNPDRPKHP